MLIGLDQWYNWACLRKFPWSFHIGGTKQILETVFKYQLFRPWRFPCQIDQTSRSQHKHSPLGDLQYLCMSIWRAFWAYALQKPNQFLGTNNVLAENQEGFTRKRSTFRLLYWLYLNLEHSSFPLSPPEDKVLSPLLFVIFLNDFSSDEPWRTSLTTVLFWFNAKMKAISSKKFGLSCKWIGRWWNKWRMGVRGSKIELKVLNLAFHLLMNWLQYL